MQCLDPLSRLGRHRQSRRDIIGQVIPAYTHAVRIDQMIAQEDRDVRGARAKVDAGGAQLVLILNQARESCGIGSDDDARKLQIAAAHTCGEVLQRGRCDRDRHQVDRQILRRHAARIRRHGGAVQCEVDGHGVDHLTPRFLRGPLTRGQRTADVTAGDCVAFNLDLAKR